jgi:hypothetical protein
LLPKVTVENAFNHRGLFRYPIDMERFPDPIFGVRLLYENQRLATSNNADRRVNFGTVTF